MSGGHPEDESSRQIANFLIMPRKCRFFANFLIMPSHPGLPLLRAVKAESPWRVGLKPEVDIAQMRHPQILESSRLAIKLLRPKPGPRQLELDLAVEQTAPKYKCSYI